MAIAQLAAGLWRRSRPFRTLVYGGVVVSVLAVVSGQMKGGSGSPSQQAQNTQNTTTNTASNTSQTANNSSTQPKQPVQCGPQGGTSLQAPLVVTQNNQTPTNVKAVGTATPKGIPLDVQARITQFVAQVNAARNDQRQGEQCARMAGSTDRLEQLDYAYLDCFEDGNDRLQRATTCQQSHDASELRFKRFLEAHSAAERDRSAEKILELANARKLLIPYDEQRERWNSLTNELSDGSDAVVDIKASDARIANLEAAAQSMSGLADLSNVPAILMLARASDLFPIDIARLSERQNEMLIVAEAARDEVADSKARLTTLSDAMSQAGSGAATERAKLISAVTALTGFDQARATAQETAMITQARSEAARFAMDDLITAAQQFTPDAPPATYEAITELAEVVNLYGGIQTPTPEQTAALETAQTARQHLSRSDQRLRELSETRDAVHRSGPGTLGERVATVLNAVTDFDRTRMDPNQKQALSDLESAREVANATEERKLTRSVPIFVKASKDDELSLNAVDELRRQLTEEGFKTVLAEEQAAVSLEINLGTLNVKTPSGFPRSADIQMTLLGRWNLTDDRIQRLRSKGIGYRDEAETDATEKALSGLVKRFVELVGN